MTSLLHFMVKKIIFSYIWLLYFQRCLFLLVPLYLGPGWIPFPPQWIWRITCTCPTILTSSAEFWAPWLGHVCWSTRWNTVSDFKSWQFTRWLCQFHCGFHAPFFYTYSCFGDKMLFIFYYTHFTYLRVVLGVFFRLKWQQIVVYNIFYMYWSSRLHLVW